MPSLLDYPAYPLLFGPSPVHPLERLTADLGGAAVWAKREDCNSGIAFGGNKTRKLEYLIPEAIAGGYDTLVSIGGIHGKVVDMIPNHALSENMDKLHEYLGV